MIVLKATASFRKPSGARLSGIHIPCRSDTDSGVMFRALAFGPPRND
jgi:hypothetical protein